MKIGLRAGHSPNCKGAIKLRDEYDCMIILFREVTKVLTSHGHTVIDCNSNASTEDGEINEGANKANNANVDYFISLHMNSYNGQAYGTEAWTYGSTSRANPIAQRLCSNFASLGLTNRGVKYNSNYKEMNRVKAPNIIFETLFCDNKHDIEEVWSPTPYEKMARLIANAIDPNIPKEEVKDKFQVVIYPFSSLADAERCSKILNEQHGWQNRVEKM